LLEQGKVYLDGVMTKVKGFVKKYDFSAHCGQKELHKLVRKVKPKNLILNHGDPPAVAEFAKWAKSEGVKVFAPEIGEKVII
jgi:putative mRNA 3-end processing factor